MHIGIGLPATIPGVDGATIIEWARRADQGGFSSLGIIDRLVYGNYDPLITLASAAGVTQRIRLMTTVLIGPLRNAAVLAKQAASLDALSGGRLTLGLGVGGREDDFHAVQAGFKNRGRRLEKQIEEMKRIWSGQSLKEGLGSIGPAPVQNGGPELLIGAYTPVALQRAGRLADGYISGGVADPEQALKLYRIVEQAWQKAGRPGRPRFVGAIYAAVGEQEVGDRAMAYIRDYYGFLGPAADAIAQSVPTTAKAVQEKIRAFENAGAEELILWPTVPDLDQVERFTQLGGDFS